MPFLDVEVYLYIAAGQASGICNGAVGSTAIYPFGCSKLTLCDGTDFGLLGLGEQVFLVLVLS